MAKEYVCTGYFTDKLTGELKYTIAPIVEGVSKEGRPFGMIQNDQRTTVDEEMKIGEIKKFSMIAE